MQKNFKVSVSVICTSGWAGLFNTFNELQKQLTLESTSSQVNSFFSIANFVFFFIIFFSNQIRTNAENGTEHGGNQNERKKTKINYNLYIQAFCFSRFLHKYFFRIKLSNYFCLSVWIQNLKKTHSFRQIKIQLPCKTNEALDTLKQ